MPELTHAAELSESCLLLVAEVEGEDEIAPRAALLSNRGATSLESRFLASTTPDGTVGDAQRLLLVLLRRADLEQDGDTRLTIGTGDRRVDLAARDVKKLIGDVAHLLRRALAPLDPQTRARALDFLSSALELVPPTERYGLSEKLFGIREALRERLPAALVSESSRRGVRVDRIMAVDERSFYVEGSLHDPETSRLTAVSPEGSRCELIDNLFRHEPGFVCFFELQAPSLRTDGWVLELESARGVSGEAQAPSVLTDPQDVKDAILNDPYMGLLPDDELMSNHVFPAISRIQERIGTDPRVKSVTEFGIRPQSAEISIVVPIYLQIQHLEVQLAQFANDPDLFAAELIYVLDSPQQAEEVLSYAADLFPIYRIPFRVAVLERNFGFAGANNAGAAMAEGRLLLLVNSDVLPERPGWLSTMRDFYDETSNIGALGPKLLYEDDSIQHAGMFFHQLPGSSKWVDGHYYKGMHRSLPAANVARAVPVVSGSCLMIDRALYEELGGLSGAYVQGDYEDSELCLRLWQEGRENWYLPEAELYHLEGQSYAETVRRSANRYNMWLHNRLWGERIAQRVQAYDSA